MLARSLTAAVWTPSGRGAVATIRVRGDLAELSERLAEFFQAASGRAFNETSIGQIGFGRWGKEASEDVVVCRVQTDACEIHCHGGDAAVRRILSDLVSLGCEVVDWRTDVKLASKQT